MYDDGSGVKLDKKKAERLYRMAADRGDHLAQTTGESCGAAAFLSAPTFAVWCLAFLNAKPAWRKDDDAAEGGMENYMNAAL
ncbi:hypothetical protein JL720_14200 [Aureococcus anophagefferens]|nr:hypothetical protein JL720_14200 [Aureococcus anophagefferens]